MGLGSPPLVQADQSGSRTRPDFASRDASKTRCAPTLHESSPLPLEIPTPTGVKKPSGGGMTAP
jgi:hypothetical protein